MVTWRQMLISTPARIIHTSQTVRVSLKAKADKGDFVEFLFHAWDTNGTRTIQFRIYEKNHTWVHCDCPWFRYNCEYALALKGSSSIINSNGSAPVRTNPTMRPQVCKHTVRCLVDLQNRAII